jgi:hypothetical protein
MSYKRFKPALKIVTLSSAVVGIAGTISNYMESSKKIELKTKKVGSKRKN